MARVEITLPDQFDFSLEVGVSVSDVNMGGHLGNDRILAMLNDAQLKFIKAKGFADLNFDGNALINVDSAIIYKSQAFYEDRLVIEVVADDFHKYGCDFVFKMTHKSNGQLVAIAKSGMLLFDYKNKKPLILSDKIKMQLQMKQGGS